MYCCKCTMYRSLVEIYAVRRCVVLQSPLREYVTGKMWHREFQSTVLTIRNGLVARARMDVEPLVQRGESRVVDMSSAGHATGGVGG